MRNGGGNAEVHGPSWSKLDDDDDILKGVGAAEGDGQILLPQDMRNAKIFSGGRCLSPR